MIYLLAAVIASVGIFLVFRAFKFRDIDTRQAIMINYLVAGMLGLALYQPSQLWFTEPWFLPSALLGVFFYIVFQLMAKVTQTSGLSIASIATKMSLIIPVSVGILFLNESVNPLKLIGILMGLLAIFLSAGTQVKQKAWMGPLLLFIGSGLIDTFLNLFQRFSVSSDAFPLFASTLFLFAFLTAFVHQITLKSHSLRRKEYAGGLILGLVNFASLYFILATLALPDWESSMVFPMLNFGIIATSTLLATLLFNERVDRSGWIGFGLATLSIGVLYFAQ